MASNADRILAPYGDEPSRKRGPIGDPSASALLTGKAWPGANLAKLKLAEELEAQGVDRDEIWRRTLWGRSPDGEWLTDTPHDKMRLSPDVLKMITKGGRTKIPSAVDPVYPSRTMPDERALLNDPTLDMPHGRDATTEFRTEDTPEMINLLMQRGGQLPGSYIDRSTEAEWSNVPEPWPGPWQTPKAVISNAPGARTRKSLTDVAVGVHRPGQPFQGYPVEALENTLMHERGHKSLYRGAANTNTTQHKMPPDIERHPEMRSVPYDKVHDYYLPEVLAETNVARKHLTPEQQQKRPYWHDYPVPEGMHIYFNNATGKWHIPPEIGNDPLNKFRPIEEEPDAPREERADLLERVYGR